MERQIPVRLKADLTRYHPGLTPGVEGYTIGAYGTWSRGSDRFVGVCFPGITTLDVLWEGLEVIDPKHLAEAKKAAAIREQEWLRATNVVKHLGPNGGFKSLSYQSTGGNGITRGCSYGPPQPGGRQGSRSLLPFPRHSHPGGAGAPPKAQPPDRSLAISFLTFNN